MSYDFMSSECCMVSGWFIESVDYWIGVLFLIILSPIYGDEYWAYLAGTDCTVSVEDMEG
jgi:hypothetical protein